MPPNNSPSDQFSQLVERLHSANNILITVSNSPSVDQLAACIGLTIALNKEGKHATAVFSGKVPSTLEFLQPENTIETNTNSLRDFIISLDKSKADKLRYKVEDDFVKIFITPYRTSITDKDLNFSQGDFNVDLIIALGVHQREQLDEAIVAHGRILHDATVACVNTDGSGDIGSINWVDTDSSSLCEMASDLILKVNKDLIDAQTATALLTGMVAETDRFGNEKAKPHTMSVSGVLMAAGASTQLISGKLAEAQHEGPGDEIPAVVETQPDEQPQAEAPKDVQKADGEMEISHEEEDPDNIHIDEHGKLQAIKELEAAQAELDAINAKQHEDAAVKPEVQELAESQPTEFDSAEQTPEPASGRGLVMEPPALGGRLTANSVPESQQYSPSTDPLSSAKDDSPMLDRSQQADVPGTTPQNQKPEEDFPLDAPNQTLSDIEKAVNSVHLTQQEQFLDEEESVPAPPPVDDARAAVEQAAQSLNDYTPEPIEALGANPVNLDLGHPEVEENGSQDNNSQPDSGNAPPPVPPPMMPPGV